MREVAVTWAGGKFAQAITIGRHTFRSDEETPVGGDDSGPGPHELLLAALGSCTSMTLKIYAERKGWPLRNVDVRVNGGREGEVYVIKRQISMHGDLDGEQRRRLLEIADKCPVHRTLSGTISITTTESAGTLETP